MGVSPCAPTDDAAVASALYEEWKRHGRHIEEYASEFVGTAFSVFCVVAVVAVLFGSSSPAVHAIPSARLRLFLAGLLLGGSGSLVAVSPLGRLSGAHLNPAVSLGFWLLDKMHFRDLLWYVLSQMAGAILGVFLGQAAFSTLAREVNNAALHPGVGVSAPAALLAECVTTGVLTGIIYAFVSHKRLLPWTPAVIPIACSVLVGLDGSYSGCGMNPARWFGPALETRLWHLSWVYLIGPCAGAAVAALARRLPRPASIPPHTGKLLHDPRYRSLFKHDQVPSRLPKQSVS